MEKKIRIPKCKESSRLDKKGKPHFKGFSSIWAVIPESVEQKVSGPSRALFSAVGNPRIRADRRPFDYDQGRAFPCYWTSDCGGASSHKGAEQYAADSELQTETPRFQKERERHRSGEEKKKENEEKGKEDEEFDARPAQNVRASSSSGTILRSLTILHAHTSLVLFFFLFFPPFYILPFFYLRISFELLRTLRCI